ncbi:MAG: hypothetical protein AAF738_04140 [Bacteroidota bacterium]
MRLTLWIPLIALFLGSFTMACNQASKKEQEQQTVLWYEMMEVHDEVMPRISEVNRLSRNLKKMKDNIPYILTSEYQKALQNLEAAEDGMMEWMVELQQLDEMRKTMRHEEIMAYLNKEKERIEQVSKDIKGSIVSAEYTKVRIDQRNQKRND